MKSPILSIVVPTYNRVNRLQLLLADFDEILDRHGDEVQLVICDNRSTDGTALVLERYLQTRPASLKVISRKVNIGMEGNIACAMNEGDGKYVWMLSDHQRLCVSAVQRAIDAMKTLEFDFAHAKVLQWSSVLDPVETVLTWEAIPPKAQGRLLFSLGNLSTLIFRREIGQSAVKAIFRCCLWSYPHLGVISEIKPSTRFVEFDSMSAFPEGAGGPKLVHDYDKISVRYCANLVCVQSQARAAGITFGRRGFFTDDYHAAFRGDVLNFLLQRGVSRSTALKTLAPVIRVNPWTLKAIGLFVLFGILLIPASTRISLAGIARDMFIRQRRQLP